MGFKVKIIAGLLAVLAVGSLLAWGHYERSQREAAEKALGAAQAQLEQSEQFRELERAQQSAVAVIDQVQWEGLRDAQAKISDLRRRDLAGAVELRVAADCPGPGVPEATGNPGVDSGAGPRLTDAARRDYYTLRDRIEQTTRQLTACQEILRAVRESFDDG